MTALLRDDIDAMPEHPSTLPRLTPLAAIESTLAAMRVRLGEAATHALHPGLIVGPAEGWTPATRLVDGSQVDELIDVAKQRWGAHAPAAATLAWKSYTYWLSLPVVTGYATARRVPLLRPEDVLIDFHDRQPFLTIGLRRPSVAVLPSDPLAVVPGVTVVPDEQALLAALRESLLDAHLSPVLERIRSRVHLGRRTLLGSVASAVSYGIRLAQGHAGPESTIETTYAVLDALDLRDLVELSITESRQVHVARRTCCLAFTLPQPKICSGCCIR